MTLRETIYTAIVTDVAASAIIGTRCYPDRLPPDVILPAISFIRVSEVDSDYRTHDRVRVTRAVARIQLNIYGTTGDEADALATAIVLLFTNCQTGAIDSSWVESRNDVYEPSLNRFRCIIDVMVNFDRTN